MANEIYLDNAATTRPYREVCEHMHHINMNVYGNPSSAHNKGLEAENCIKKSRSSVAAVINASPRDIYFTSGGTEANNLAIIGFLTANPSRGKHIITSKIEHSSVLEVFKHLQSLGYTVDFISVDKKGVVNISELESKLTPETALISMMCVNNEIGSIAPIAEIAAMKNRVSPKAALHVDGVQAYCKVPIDVATLGADLISASSHKIHGPKGVGALYISRNVKLNPVLFGGGQELKLRSGTENVAGICGFGLAAEMSHATFSESVKKADSLKRNFIDGLLHSVSGVKIISSEDSSPYILSVSFPGVRSEVLLNHLEQKGIYVSAGSACSAKKNSHSHVLTAMGLTPEEVDGTIRFSFSSFTTETELKEALTALQIIVPKIKVRSGGRR